jgi:ATP-dependent Clp protease adaptor protein ClpS
MFGEKGKTKLLDEPQNETRLPPPYKVILHNDDVNEMLYVVETIVNLTPLKPQQAFEKMVEAHTTGSTILLVCHKERAELYEEQFRSCRLIVTIEPE